MNEGNQEKRNVMVLFLSNFLFDDLNKDKQTLTGEKLAPKNIRKAASNFRITRRNDNQEEVITSACIQTNEAPIKDVLFHLGGEPLDAIFCFVSEKVGGRGKFAGKKVLVWDSPEAEKPREYENHIELFWERLQAINEDATLRNILKKPLTKDIFHMVDFNESASDPSAECIRATLELERRIRDYMEHEKKSDGEMMSMKNCRLFADITGGMRTANMAMSAATQLLQYDGAHLERVVYSDFAPGRNLNPVSDVQPINDLYKLVAGVYAFTQYGRSEALKDYFGDETYAPLIELRQAMDDFSEAVQLCQEGMFEKALKKLTKKLIDFSDQVGQEPNISAKVALFSHMIPNLKAIYFDLFAKDAQGVYLKDNEGHYKTDRIKIIRWCVKNKLLQQAATFCTEWLPEYLIDHGVVYTDDWDFQKYIISSKNAANKKQKEDQDKYGKKHFLMKCITPSDEHDFPIGKVCDTSIRDAITQLIDNKIERDTAVKILSAKFVKRLLGCLNSIPQSISNVRMEKKANNECLQAVVNDLVKPADGKKSSMNPKNIKDTNILSRLKEWTTNLDKWYRNALFKLPRSTKKDVYIANRPVYIVDDQSGNAAKLTKALLLCKLLKTDLTDQDLKDAVYYIEEYTYIRTKLRNKINHADVGGDNESIPDRDFKMEVDYIANYLNGYLDNLDLLKNKPTPHFTGLWAENAKEEATS